MSRKRFTAQIIGLLREADVKLSQGRNVGKFSGRWPPQASEIIFLSLQQTLSVASGNPHFNSKSKVEDE